MEVSESVTDLLALAASGDRSAFDRAFPLVYGELRRLARRQLARERAGHTLTSAALVHEAYLRLADQTRGQWRNRAHFLAVASTAMRRILVDHARRHRAARRGGRVVTIMLDTVDAVAAEDRNELLVNLDEALARLEQFDARQARVVECRFFGGLTEEETAEVLGIGLRTAKRDWAKARSWLFQELYPDVVA
jgi:RNA polymerase sigma factor (TIGR02999 family)